MIQFIKRLFCKHNNVYYNTWFIQHNKGCKCVYNVYELTKCKHCNKTIDNVLIYKDITKFKVNSLITNNNENNLEVH